jgi:hypothetical protein
MSDGKKQKRAAREERLRAALRENLKRRKAQARGRDRPPAQESDENTPGPERSDGPEHC